VPTASSQLVSFSLLDTLKQYHISPKKRYWPKLLPPVKKTCMKNEGHEGK
jgi:hypothetical protein